MPRNIQAYTIHYGAKMRRLVATTSKREAARLMGVSEYDFRLYGMFAGHADRALAVKRPGVVFEREQTSRAEIDWKVIDPKPYEPRRVARQEPPAALEVPDPQSPRARTYMDELMALAKLPRSHALTTLVPGREYIVKGKPMVELAGVVHDQIPGVTIGAIHEVLRVLDDIGAGVVVPMRPLPRGEIRAIFMAHGFTVKEGQTDLKPYVYDAAEALLKAAVRLQPVSKKD